MTSEASLSEENLNITPQIVFFVCFFFRKLYYHIMSFRYKNFVTSHIMMPCMVMYKVCRDSYTTWYITKITGIFHFVQEILGGGCCGQFHGSGDFLNAGFKTRAF